MSHDYGKWMVSYDNGVKLGVIDLTCPFCYHNIVAPKVDVPKYCSYCGKNMFEENKRMLLLAYAKEIQEYCDIMDCTECTFSIRDTDTLRIKCSLNENTPWAWDIETMMKECDSDVSKERNPIERL